jgi:formate dehydrogenase subunit gamma
MAIERYRRRARSFHTAVYLATLLLLYGGWWLLVGREGEPSVLARALGQSDSAIHQSLGWLLLALAVVSLVINRNGVVSFVRETLRLDRGDMAWLARWPRALFSGRFGRHEGHFDPGQRLANIVMVLCFAGLLGSGAGLAVLGGGPAFAWLHRIHTWATFILTPLIAAHVLVAIGVLPGYRGVWRSMHLGGRLPLDTARRLWPGWTERKVADTPVRLDQPERLHALASKRP